MNFSHALERLKEGAFVTRTGWNGKGMFLYYVPGGQRDDPRAPAAGIPARSVPNVPRLPYIAMFTADQCVVPWLASQTDLLSNDWMEVDAKVGASGPEAITPKEG